MFFSGRAGPVTSLSRRAQRAEHWLSGKRNKLSRGVSRARATARRSGSGKQDRRIVGHHLAWPSFIIIFHHHLSPPTSDRHRCRFTCILSSEPSPPHSFHPIMTCLRLLVFVLSQWLAHVSGFWSINSRTCRISSLASTLMIRGGDVQIIHSLSEVDLIINQAPANQLIVLDFASNNCPPCEMIAPIYHELSELDEFDSVLFLKVNVSDHPEVAERHGVDGWPTFLLFKNGERIDEIVGGRAARDGLHSLVAKYK